MPTPTIFEGINPRGTQTLIPCKDAKAQNGVIANTKLIKDTVGWSGKNKWNVKDSSIAYDASSGLIYTVLEKGYQVTNSTAAEWASLKMITASNLKANTDYKLSTDIIITSGTARIIVSGATSQGGTYTNIVDSQNITSNGRKEITFNTGNYTWLRVTIYSTVGTSTTGNVKYDDFMIRSADILDDTYEPYFGSTAFPRSEQAVLGAKNLLPLTFSGTTQNNVVFTVDDDGVININGTNSGEAFAVIISPYSKWLKDGRYILNGCSGGSASTYKLDIDSPSGAFATNYDGDTEFTMVNGANNYRIRIVVYAGAVMNNVKIRPMIRLATDTDPTYAPYVMTNEQLTNLGLVYRGAIPSGASLDDYVEVGIWDINGTNPTNFPTGSSGYVPMLVLPRWGHGNIKQIIISRNNEIYLRNKNDGESWSSWYKFAGTVVS